MSEPVTPNYRDHLQEDCRAHVLGAITSTYAAADELVEGRSQSALIEIDRAIALLTEARKFVQNHPGGAEHRK